MEKINIGIRDVDEETFRKFRAMAIERKLRLGEAIDKAMKLMLIKKDSFSDMLIHSENVAKKLWDNKEDEFWNDV
jgi:hypothetical protein